MPATSRDLAVTRLRTPADVVAAVPLLCGYVPHESLVVLSTRGRNRRVGLTMRFDLPPPEHETTVAREAAARLHADRGTGALVVVHTEGAGDEGELARASLVDALTVECREQGIEVLDALLVQRDRWVSYRCDDASCCPRSGTPVAEPGRQLGDLAAAQVLLGRPVLGSRDELVAWLAPPLPGTAAAQHVESARARYSERRARHGRVAVGQEALRQLHSLLDRCAEQPAEVEAGEAARLAVALHDVLVRDEVATWALDRPGDLLTVLPEIAKHVGPPHDAPVATLVGWVAYCEGNGALANVALDRALAADPGYAMALLLRQSLDRQVPPSEVRALLRAGRAALHGSTPWTNVTGRR